MPDSFFSFFFIIIITIIFFFELMSCSYLKNHELIVIFSWSITERNGLLLSLTLPPNRLKLATLFLFYSILFVTLFLNKKKKKLLWQVV